MSNDWSDKEVEIIVSDYFSMLSDELKGIAINKSTHRKKLMTLVSRSNGSIEFKHQNISAALIRLGLPFIKGYKPLYNLQKELTATILRFISSHPSIIELFDTFSNSINLNLDKPKFESWIVDKPELTEVLQEPKEIYRRAYKVNYLEKEQLNRTLGMKGEELVMEFERWQLIHAGKENLASSVEWVSRDIGDGLGFDILSKSLNGKDKYIEVKTTKLGKETPFFFTSNELRFSIEKSNDFHLYRLFDFNATPKMFSLNGRYDSFCRIEPVAYKGWF